MEETQNFTGPQGPAPVKKKQESGLFASILKFVGYMLGLYGVLGYVANLFGYQLKISGSRLGKVTLEVLIPLLILSAIFWGGGYLIDVFQRRKNKNKEQ